MIDSAEFAKRLRLDERDKAGQRDDDLTDAKRVSPARPVADVSPVAELRQYLARGNFIDRSGID